eukprot:GSChrysophyteH1.ASY1.ANO1.472.1 assembled CDS
MLRPRDEIDEVKNRINRRLFKSSHGSPERRAAAGGGNHELVRKLPRQQRDHFSLALQKAPLLSLSSFSCGASVLLEIAQLDFSNRSAMMESYTEIRRMYKGGDPKERDRRLSPNRAKKEHLRMRSAMFVDRNETFHSATNTFNTLLTACAAVGMFALAWGKKHSVSR